MLLARSIPILPLAALLTAPGLAQPTVPIRARTRSQTPPRAVPAFPIGTPIAIAAPLGLPPVPIPADNPPTRETVALGRKLFFDPIFSRDNTISCASCHDPKAGFADPRTVSLGVGGLEGTRNAPSVLNSAYNAFQFWDGRAATLEQQAEGPVQNPVEFVHSLAGVERKLAAHPEYPRLFAEAWGPGKITYDMVAKSIASYERTLVSGNSPFDRFYYGGDQNAISESAKRGLRFFLDPSLEAANCISCHRIDTGFATFTEARFHNTGVAVDPVTRAILDPGRQAISGEARLTGAFRTMTLRNIALTAPYMHDGSLKTLEEVVDFYFQSGRANSFLSNDMPRPGLRDIPDDLKPQAKKDLVEFMKTLTGDMPPDAVPPQN
ncbi:MAG: cytochrome c peroxidase [Bryobacteraceae bacterium]